MSPLQSTAEGRKGRNSRSVDNQLCRGNKGGSDGNEILHSELIHREKRVTGRGETSRPLGSRQISALYKIDVCSFRNPINGVCGVIFGTVDR